MLRVVLALLVSMSAFNVYSQERFWLGEIKYLFSECSPMDVRVSVKDETTQITGLTPPMIENIVVSQLLLAKLYVPVDGQAENHKQILSVVLETRHTAVALRIQLHREIDLGYGLPGYAVVWEAGVFGTAEQGRHLELLPALVVRNVNEFIAKYLPMNDGGLPCSEWDKYREEQCEGEREAYGEGNEVTSWCN